MQKLNIGYVQSGGAPTLVSTGVAMPSGWVTLKVGTRPADGGVTVVAGNPTDGFPLVTSFTNTLMQTNQGCGIFVDSQGRNLDLRWDNFTVTEGSL